MGTTAENDSVAVDNLDQYNIESNESFLEWEGLSVDDSIARLQSSPDGLTTAQVASRHAEHGPNVFAVSQSSRVRSLLSFLWNPLSWILEVAIITALVFRQYVDALVILVMLGMNMIIYFYGDNASSNAIAVLEDQLALKSHVKRDGEWREVAASDLTIGDVVSIQDGDVVPADCKILTSGILRCDQSALTGQIQSPNKAQGDICFSGAIVKSGTGEAIVLAIGNNTFFGQAVDLLKRRRRSRLHRVLTSIGNFTIVFIVVMIILELAIQVGHRASPWNSAIANTLVIIIGAVPIAMPTVLSVIMAFGTMALSKKEIIVRRLNAIEELASMDILCANKSGTICTGEIEIMENETIVINGHTAEEVLFYAALAAEPNKTEPVDQVVIDKCPQSESLWVELERLHFVPFDPVQKKTIASVRVRANGNTFRAAKGAPWVILAMDRYSDLVRDEIEAKINDLAARGFNMMGVAVSRDPADMPIDKVHWEMVGLLALKDPPREESATSMKDAEGVGVQVKMITGETLSSAVETCKVLGVPSSLETGKALDENAEDDFVEKTDGFAELYPKHKYSIVERLQRLDHVVGISGNSVNDCPALQRSDIGIAVAGSTEAARIVSDIVLLVPGLSIIVDAILLSRMIFRRMHTYVTTSVATSVQVILTFGLLTVFFDWYFPAFVILIMVVLNDGTMLAMAKDDAIPSQEPERWNLKALFIQAVAFGVWLAMGAILLFVLARQTSILSKVFGLESMHTFGSPFRVGSNSDPLCNWGLWFKPTDLSSCNDRSLIGKVGDAKHANTIWRAYGISASIDELSTCHRALAGEVCSIQQHRLARLRSFIFLVVSITGHAVIFAARTKDWMWKSRPGNSLIAAFILSQAVATILSIFGFGRIFSARTYFAGLDVSSALFAWIWALLLILPLDLIKFAVAKSVGSDMYPDIDRRGSKEDVDKRMSSIRSARSSLAEAEAVKKRSTMAAESKKSSQEPSAPPRKSIDIVNDLKQQHPAA